MPSSWRAAEKSRKAALRRDCCGVALGFSGARALDEDDEDDDGAAADANGGAVDDDEDEDDEEDEAANALRLKSMASSCAEDIPKEVRTKRRCTPDERGGVRRCGSSRSIFSVLPVASRYRQW